MFSMLYIYSINIYELKLLKLLYSTYSNQEAFMISKHSNNLQFRIIRMTRAHVLTPWPIGRVIGTRPLLTPLTSPSVWTRTRAVDGVASASVGARTRLTAT